MRAMSTGPVGAGPIAGKGNVAGPRVLGAGLIAGVSPIAGQGMVVAGLVAGVAAVAWRAVGAGLVAGECAVAGRVGPVAVTVGAVDRSVIPAMGTAPTLAMAIIVIHWTGAVAWEGAVASARGEGLVAVACVVRGPVAVGACAVDEERHVVGRGPLACAPAGSGRIRKGPSGLPRQHDTRGQGSSAVHVTCVSGSERAGLPAPITCALSL